MGESLNVLRGITTTLIERESEARQWEKRFRALLDIIPIGAMLTQDRVIFYANKTLEDLTGYVIGELIGKSTRLLYCTENDWHSVGSSILNRLEVEERVMIRKKSGELVPCKLQSKIIDIEDMEMVVLLCDEG